MPDIERERALKDLASRAARLEASTARPIPGSAGERAVGKAYQIVGQLVAGPVIGLGIGFGVDWLLGSMPWGMIIGVLLGFAGAIYAAKLTADRLMAQAKAEGTVGHAVPDDEDEEL